MTSCLSYFQLWSWIPSKKVNTSRCLVRMWLLLSSPKERRSEMWRQLKYHDWQIRNLFAGNSSWSDRGNQVWYKPYQEDPCRQRQVPINTQSYFQVLIDKLCILMIPKKQKDSIPKQLSLQEFEEWKCPIFYISHLAVVNHRSHPRHVMIVFNSSHMHEGV